MPEPVFRRPPQLIPNPSTQGHTAIRKANACLLALMLCCCLCLCVPRAVSCRVTTVLVLLSVSPPPPLSQSQMAVPVIIMCCREVTMSALREWAAAAGGAAHKVRHTGLTERHVATAGLRVWPGGFA